MSLFSPAPGSPAQHRTRRLGSAVASAVVLGMIFACVGVTAAHAGAMDVSIVASNAITQKSGSPFTYNISLPCAGTGTGADANACFDSVVTIPLDNSIGMDGWVYSVTGGPAGFVQSTTVDAANHQLVITLKTPIVAGTAQNISLSVTPPNLITPDGTSWSLLPTVKGNDSVGTPIAPRTAQTAATGTATASVPLSVSKSTPKSFYYEGSTFDYTVAVTCPGSMPVGSLYASKIVVSDVLPAGVTFISTSAPGAAYDLPTRTVSWEYPDDASVPVACGGTAPFAAAATQTISVSVDPLAVGTIEKVTNTVSATATARGSVAPDGPQTATRDVTLLATGSIPGPGATLITKDSAGQFRQSSSGGVRGTYPGRWLPFSTPPSTADSAPASYTIVARNATGGYQYELTDALPCLDNLTTLVYTASPGVCANPAFHVTSLRLNLGGTVADGSAYPLPTYVRTDGSTGTAVYESSAARTINWHIPTSDVGDVAAIHLPRDVSQEDRTSDSVVVNGYADPSTTDGQVLRNNASTELYWNGASQATQQSNSADIFIVNEAQIGTEKTVADVGAANGTQARVTLASTLVVPTAPSEDLIVTDLLPAGSTLVTDPAAFTATLSRQGASSVNVSGALVVEVIDNFTGTQQLIRVTLPASSFPVQANRFRLALGGFVITKPATPGTYTNTAQTFYDATNLSGNCYAGTYSSDDSAGLRGSTTTATGNCQAAATYKTVTSATADYSLVKKVKGDLDPDFRSSPAIGHVALDQGIADYQLIWTNTGSPALNGVVLYDILPRVGDTGITYLQHSTPRNSEFTPTLASVEPAPAGVTISYSSAANPCRNEVFPDVQNVGCAAASWTTDPATIGGLGQVTALRIEATNGYATGAGFTVGLGLSVPKINKNMVAWNSVAAFAKNASGGQSAGVTEAPAVGITGSLHGLALDKQVDATAAKPGDRLTYTLTATNIGTSASAQTIVKDVMPAGLDFVSADNGGSYDTTSRTVTWTLASLAPDDDVVFTVVGTVGQLQLTNSLVNRALVVNPPGYSLPTYALPCDPSSDATCIGVTVPVSTLSFTGASGIRIAIGVGMVLTLLGVMALLVMRFRRRRAA